MTALMESPVAEFAGVDAAEYEAAIARGAVPVDIRRGAERAAGGALPGALAIAAELVVTRLDPASPRRLSVAAADVEWLLISEDGELAAMAQHALRVVGVEAVTHVSGGFRELVRHSAVGAGVAATHVRREADAIAAH